MQGRATTVVRALQSRRRMTPFSTSQSTLLLKLQCLPHALEKRRTSASCSSVSFTLMLYVEVTLCQCFVADRVSCMPQPLPCSRAACSKTVTATNVLLRAPPCLLFGLNWATASASASEIMELLDVIQLTLNLGDMYTNLDDRAHRGKYVYHLSGLVCYYGSHYALFTYNVEIQRWMMSVP